MSDVPAHTFDPLNRAPFAAMPGPPSDGDGSTALEAELVQVREALSRRTHELAASLRDEDGVLHFLERIGTTIAETQDVDTLLQTVIDAATQVSGAAFGVFFHRDESTSVPGDGAQPTPAGPPSSDLSSSRAIPRLAMAGIAQSPEESNAALRIAALLNVGWRADGTMRCADVTREARYGAAAAWFGLAEGFAPLRSFLVVPVTLRSGRNVGGLFFGHPAVGVFTARTERIVVGVAAHAAVALDNVRLVEEMRRAALERERLLEAERAARADSARAAHIKDDFLSTLSHELRTPLTAILGWAKVLLLQGSNAHMQQRGLEAIERNAAAQAALIEQLLDMSRIVSGQVTMEMRDTDLADVVDVAILDARQSAIARQIRLVRHVVRSKCGVRGDPARLRQVVENLLSNAIKFTPPGGRIDIALAHVDGHVELSVADTGCGIEPEFLAHVFDQFRQADASTTRRHGGLGLGLAVVRQLVQLHGGAVMAHSAGPGQGSRFIVRLPRGTAAEAVGRAPKPADGPPSDEAVLSNADLHGVRLLVVDDDSDVREVIAQLLVGRGADVRQVANAAEALDEFRRFRPDVLLSDIGMPERDGYALIRDIRGLETAQGGDVPAVAITAFARSEDRARAILAGYQAHIAKPIQPDELVAMVAGLAESRKAA